MRNYSATNHNRFNGFASNPVANPQFLFSAYDFSGVGWNPSSIAFQYTLVSPIHFVGANHIKPAIGQALRFVATDGTVHSYTVEALTAIKNDAGENSDLFIGRLSTAAANNITYYPYLNYNNDANYIGKNVIMHGKFVRAGWQTVDNIDFSESSTTNETRTFRSIYTVASGNDDDCYLENGDSGSPAFILHNGTPAIIGTHSLVDVDTNEITNHSNFIPYYDDKLDAVMANHGYHMKRAIPGNTNLTLNHQAPAGIIRAGHSFNINLTLNNTGNKRADNLRLRNTFPAGTSITNATGVDWFDQSTPTAAEARRAKLDSFTTTNYSLDVSIPSPGTHNQEVTFWSDQSPVSTQVFTFNVIESYLSWSSALSNNSPNEDNDNDGVSNLLEYAFGGDPSISSQAIAGGTHPLIPTLNKTTSGYQISYLRRTDYIQRALTYELTSSATMSSGSWSNANAMITNTTITNINSDFELVTQTLNNTSNTRFFRIQITLNES